MRAALPVAALTILLAACTEHEAPAPADAPPPAVAETPAGTPFINNVDVTKPLRAVGTEPFWAVEIADTGIKISRVDQPELTAPGSAPVLEGDAAVWTGAASDGAMLAIRLTAGPCSDGMSDRTYPLTAEVSLGPTKLKGCAATVEALSRAGESGEVR